MNAGRITSSPLFAHLKAQGKAQREKELLENGRATESDLRATEQALKIAGKKTPPLPPPLRKEETPT